MSFGNPSELCLLAQIFFVRLMLFSVGACLVFIASTKHKISHLCSTAIHIRRDEMLRPCRESRGKIYQAFWLRFCILQAIINWTRGRPGNDATPMYMYHICIIIIRILCILKK